MHRYKFVTSAMTLTSAFVSNVAFAQTGNSIVLEEVVVTAERREQSVQDIPIAVSVISGDTIEARGVTDIRSIANIVPGVQLIEVGQQPGLLIRGVGNAVTNVGQDPASSYNVDGVPIARPLGANAAIFDLQRVEVLKGPQGTLYGRNSTAGAINLISKKPVLDKYEGSVSMRMGNYHSVQTQLIGNLPVGDQFALRIGGNYSKRDGYLSNGSDDADSKTVRVRALWQPSDVFNILASATYSRLGGQGPGDVPLKNNNSFVYPNDPWRLDTNNPATAPFGIYQDGVVPGNLTVPAGLSNQKLISQNYTVEVNWDLGGVKLTALPAYIKTDYDAVTYNGGFRQVYSSHDKQTSLEVRLASDYDSALQWIVGGFYMEDDQFAFNDIHSNFAAGGVLGRLISNWPIDLTTYAAFGQGTYSLTDRLRLTLGLRYTKDAKESNLSSFQSFFLNNNPFGPAVVGSSDTSWDYTSYRAGVDFDLTPNSLLYANVSNAYKAGGDNQGLSTGPAGRSSYDPEKLTSYQIGSKNTLLNGRLLLNAEAWYWDWENLQGFGFGCLNTPVPVANPPGQCTAPGLAFAGVTRNLGSAHNYGVETEISWAATDNDVLILNATYVIGRFDKARAVSGNVLDGQDTTRTPKFSGVVGYSHDWVLGNGARISAGVRDKFSSEAVLSSATITAPAIIDGSWHQISANLDFTSANGQWTLGLWGENLNEADNLVFAGSTPAGLWGHPTPPRTYGVRLKLDF